MQKRAHFDLKPIANLIFSFTKEFFYVLIVLSYFNKVNQQILINWHGRQTKFIEQTKI